MKYRIYNRRYLKFLLKKDSIIKIGVEGQVKSVTMTNFLHVPNATVVAVARRDLSVQ